MPAPETKQAIRNSDGVPTQPMAPVVTAITSRPVRIRGLRPCTSESRELNDTATTLPSANTDRARPAIIAPSTCQPSRPVPANAVAANRGITELRTPNVAQPLAKKETSAAR